MEGCFVTVQTPRFAFVRADGDDTNLYVSRPALAGLPRTPRAGDRVRFRVGETPDGRRRAIDLVLTDQERMS